MLGHSSVRANLSCCEADLGITEDVALVHVNGEALLLPSDDGILTAKRLIVPMMMTTMPAAMTILQKASPRDFWLVACLLRLPRTLLPSKSIAAPSMTKPDLWLKSGQLRAT